MKVWKVNRIYRLIESVYLCADIFVLRIVCLCIGIHLGSHNTDMLYVWLDMIGNVVL